MGARVPDGYFNQTYMVEFEVPGALDGTTPSPDINFSEGAGEDPQQIFRPEVEGDLGLIDVDYLVSELDNEGARGNRWIAVFWLDASVAGGAGATLEVVDAVTGAPVTQEAIAALAGVSRLYRRSGILVPQGSLLRISGFAAGPTSHRIRLHISYLTDDGLLFAQNVMCCFEQAGGAVETWQQVLQNGPASGGEDALMTGGSQFRLQAGSDIHFEIGAGGSGGMNWDNSTNARQAAIDYDDGTSLMTFRVSNVDEMQLSAAAMSPVLTGGLDIGTDSLRWDDGFINRLLIAGALAADGIAAANDGIFGDGGATDRGISLYTDGIGTFAVYGVAATSDGSVTYDTGSGTWSMEIAGSGGDYTWTSSVFSQVGGATIGAMGDLWPQLFAEGARWAVEPSASAVTAANERIIIADASSASVTITLPSAAAGIDYIIIVLDVTNGVTIDRQVGDNINGAASSKSVSVVGRYFVTAEDATDWWLHGPAAQVA